MRINELSGPVHEAVRLMKARTHARLVSIISKGLADPVIKFEESYDAFVSDLTTSGEALDSWCKLLTYYRAHLSTNVTPDDINNFFDVVFTDYRNIDAAFGPEFVIEGTPTLSMLLYFLIRYTLHWEHMDGVSDDKSA